MVRESTVVRMVFGLALSISGATAFGTVNVRFAGVIDVVEAGLPFGDQISVGMPFVGTYSYDLGAEDTVPNDSSYGAYRFAGHAMSVDIGTLTFTASGIVILISSQSHLDMYSVKNTSGFAANGVGWAHMLVNLADLTGAALNSDALPMGPPTLDDFSVRDFGLIQVGHLPPSVSGTITEVMRFPEPSTLTLLLVSAAGAATRRRSSGEGRSEARVVVACQ